MRYLTIFMAMLWILIVYSQVAQSQSHPLALGVRLPLQWERQHAEVEYSFGNEVVRGKAVNFGLDILVERERRPWKIYGGVGHFRNRVNIRRPFDHTVFNPVRDSFPIGTLTRSYTYYLFRIPAGIKYTLMTSDKQIVDVGIENNLNWCLRRKYNGPKPIGISKDNVYAQPSWFGNTVNIFRCCRLQGIPMNIADKALCLRICCIKPPATFGDR